MDLVLGLLIFTILAIVKDREIVLGLVVFVPDLDQERPDQVLGLFVRNRVHTRGVFTVSIILQPFTRISDFPETECCR